MKLDFLKTTSAAALALSLMVAPAAAQEMFSDWDANADAGIAQDEFTTGFGEAGVYDRYDADGNGMLTEAEFGEGMGDAGLFNERFGEDAYAEWDADDDGMLTETEFNEGVYAGYDADESGVIEEPEYADVGDDMGDGGLFDV